MNEVADIREKTQAEIPFSVLEYSAVFKKAILEAWTVPAFLISAVLNALEPLTKPRKESVRCLRALYQLIATSVEMFPAEITGW